MNDDRTHDDIHYLKKIAQDLQVACKYLHRVAERLEEYGNNIIRDSEDQENETTIFS